MFKRIAATGLGLAIAGFCAPSGYAQATPGQPQTGNSPPLQAPPTVPVAVPPPTDPLLAGQPTVVTVVNQDFRFVTWEGSRGTDIFSPERGKGSQLYAPLTLGTVVDFSGAARWELIAKSAYVWSNHATKGQEATYSGPTDTQLSATVSLGGFPYVRPLAGVVVNVPTGESFLPGQRRFLRMAPDLVEIGAYGEGLNINPIIGFTFSPIPQVTWTPSVGYAWRGAFDREGGKFVVIDKGFTPPDDVKTVDLTSTRVATDPGDVLTASLSTVAKFGNLSLESTTSFTSESEVTQNGIPVGRKGAGYISNLSGLYVVSPTFGIIFNGSWRFNEKNRVPMDLPSAGHPFGAGGLIEEAKNSNSHVLIGGIQPTFVLSDNVRLGVNYSILHRTENY